MAGSNLADPQPGPMFGLTIIGEAEVIKAADIATQQQEDDE